MKPYRYRVQALTQFGDVEYYLLYEEGDAVSTKHASHRHYFRAETNMSRISRSSIWVTLHLREMVM